MMVEMKKHNVYVFMLSKKRVPKFFTTQVLSKFVICSICVETKNNNILNFAQIKYEI